MTERHRTFAAAVLLTFSLATAVCFVSNNLNSRRQHRDETANRESAAFIGVLWIAVTTLDDASRLKRVTQGAAIMLVALSVTLALRLVFDIRGARVLNRVAENSVSAMLAVAANRPFMSWSMLLVASLAPALAVTGATWTRVSAVGRRIIVAGLCVAAASLVIGSPEEIRIMAPAATMLVCGLAVSEVRNSTPL